MEQHVVQNVIDWNIIRRDQARHSAMLHQHDRPEMLEAQRNMRRFQHNIDMLNAQLQS